MQEIRTEQAEKIARSIGIPPRPTIIVALNEERAKPDPNLRQIAALIAADVGLSAAMLKTVNSPFFGLGHKISAVPQAVNMLGLTNVTNIVTGLVLRTVLSGAGGNMEHFWDSATHVATVAAYLASRLPGISSNQAYTYGLFHDCGIPLLMQKYPDYKDTLDKASTGGEDGLTAVEDAKYDTNHAVIGHFLARSWYLPDIVCQAILYHHDASALTPDSGVDPEVCTLVALGHVAERLAESYLRPAEGLVQRQNETLALAYLGLGQDEYAELRTDTYGKLDKLRGV